MQVADEDVSEFLNQVRQYGLDRGLKSVDSTKDQPPPPPSTSTTNLTLPWLSSPLPHSSKTSSSSKTAPEQTTSSPLSQTITTTAFSKFTYLARHCPEKTLAVIYAFQDLGMVERFSVPLETLCRFTMRVKNGYRENPYHNWTHAFSVFHFAYLLVKNLKLQQLIGELPCYAFLIAALCHDLDHRGTNSAFEISSKSSLAALYSSKGSVMERHHFAQTLALINTSGCNVFQGMKPEDNKLALDYIYLIILATDLSRHLRITNQLEKLAEEIKNKNIHEHLSNARECQSLGKSMKNADQSVNNESHAETLMLSLLMTSSDLSDQTKDWSTTKNTAKNIYEEFFDQGDREKGMGLSPIPQMDRDLACVPQVQVGFMDHVAAPVYKILAQVFPETQEVIDRVNLNRERWACISKSWEELKKPPSESISVLDDGFDKVLEGNDELKTAGGF